MPGVVVSLELICAALILGCKMCHRLEWIEEKVPPTYYRKLQI